MFSPKILSPDIDITKVNLNSPSTLFDQLQVQANKPEEAAKASNQLQTPFGPVSLPDLSSFGMSSGSGNLKRS